MHTDPVARIYAQALLEAAQAKGREVVVGEGLAVLVGGIEAAPELRAFIETPVMDASPKKRALEALRGKVDDLVIDFVSLVIDKGRAGALVEIASAYRDLADEAAGRVRVSATSAVALGADQRQKLEETLRATLQKEIVVETAVEPDLIGGLVLQVGDKIYDGSIRSQLRRARSAMMRSSGYYENQS